MPGRWSGGQLRAAPRGFDERARRGIGRQAGIAKAGPHEGKGLGVVSFDFDRDGHQDVYVANDTTPNFLWRNKGDGTFEEIAFGLTGMRHGELNGLQWPCVRFNDAKPLIEVRRSLTEIPKKAGGPILEPPKTRAGYRDIPIPSELVSELRRWRLACPPSELDLVFPNSLGGPTTRKTNEKKLKRTMERAKIKVLSMHNLRHSFASQHVIAGTPVTEIALMMGHSSTEVTLKLYAHWAKGEKSEAAAVLAGRIFAVKVAKSRHEGQ